MKPLAFAWMLFSLFMGQTLPAQTDVTPTVLTFDEAVALAGENRSPSTAVPLRGEIGRLRQALLPTVRAEVSGNATRTLEFFRDGPVDLRATSSVIAFDYPLFTTALTRARIETVEAKLRRISETGGVNDTRFLQVLDVFGQLYLSQRQAELIRPLYERLSHEATRSAVLVSSGEITNLAAAEWREIALSYASQLLELDARRIDAAAKLQLYTGLESEPRVIVAFDEEVAATGTGHIHDAQSLATTIAVEDSRHRLREALAANRFRASLSGFVGVGAAESTFLTGRSDGTFGIYGLRVHLSYPLIGGAAAIQIAEARATLEQTLVIQQAARDAVRARVSEYQVRAQTAARRIDLLHQSVNAARDREASLRRLVSGGLRQESEVLRAEAERTRRELELVSAQVERWKASRVLARMGASTEDAHR